MKLIFYEPHHHKNTNALKLMCKTLSIDLEITNDYNRILKNDYNILISNIHYIEPEIIPENIKIIYGPQFWVFPSGPIVGELNNIYVKRCVYNCLSEWVKNLYMEIVPSLKVPLVPLPFAVDVDFFKPDISIEKTIDCILYVKLRDKDIINNVIKILENKKLSYIVINYGNYEETTYINMLHKSKFMISIDRHESQGFALEEAMSMNIPLLVLDATTMYSEISNNGKSIYMHMKPKKLISTSVPYWSEKCGIKLETENIEEISKSIDNMIVNYTSYNPREYILETLSPKVCMERILNYFNL